MINIDINPILSNMLAAPVLRHTATDTPLHGGTLGDVRLVSGTAETADGRSLPYRIVHKTQRRWYRLGDAPSWRREYDLYTSNFGAIFEDALRWPACYHAQMNGDDEIQIWMEYIDGISGNDLPLEVLERTALELGRLQGRLYTHPEPLAGIDCLCDTGFLAREYAQWTPETEEARYLYSEDCPLPAHLRRMLIDTQRHSAQILGAIARLPVVLCHRDVWVENVLYADGQIRLIDWDGASWGYMGEDIATLIVDGTPPERICEYAERLVPAYLAGLSAYMDLTGALELPIRDMILIKFGYRFLQAYQFARSPEERQEPLTALQRIYEMQG